MSLQLRRDRPAYYRSVREGGQVRSVYVASGPAAVALAGRDAQAKAEAKAEAKARREQDEAQEREIAEWFDAVEAVARAVLIASGYHQHKRGKWRKRRGPTT